MPLHHRLALSHSVQGKGLPSICSQPLHRDCFELTWPAVFNTSHPDIHNSIHAVADEPRSTVHMNVLDP
jgi:hypothetical protein